MDTRRQARAVVIYGQGCLQSRRRRASQPEGLPGCAAHGVVAAHLCTL